MCMLCTVLFFLFLVLFFFFRKNQQMELQGSLQPHSCVCALSRMEDMKFRGEMPNKKTVQRSSAGRWFKRNDLQFTRNATEHTNIKPVPLTQLLKLLIPLFCIVWSWLFIHHGTGTAFGNFSCLCLGWAGGKKTYFFPSECNRDETGLNQLLQQATPLWQQSS